LAKNFYVINFRNRKTLLGRETKELFLGSSAYNSFSPQKKVEFLLKTCDDYEQKGDWQAIRTLTSEALLLCKSISARSILYTIHQKRYKANKELKYYDLAWWDTVKMVQLEPSSTNWVLSGDMSMLMGGYPQAVRCFTEALQRNKDNPTIKEKLNEAESKAREASELAVRTNRKVPFLGRFSPHAFDFNSKKIEENIEFFTSLNYELKLHGYHIAVTNTKEHGRGIRALKDFEPGEVIVAEWPFVMNTLRTDVCSHCAMLLKTTPVKCDKNKQCTAVYCSENCRAMAWNFHHAAVCGNSKLMNGKTKELIEKHTTTGPLNILSIIRLIAMSKTRAVDARQYEAYNALMGRDWAQPQEFGRLDALLDAYWCQFEAVSDDMNLRHYPEYDWETFLEFKFKTGLNGWAFLPVLPSEERQERSVTQMIFSIYTAGCYFNHSCTPNAAKTMNPEIGSLAFVQAQTKIKKDEEITLSYYAEENAVATGMLKFGIDCNCASCLQAKSQWKELMKRREDPVLSET
jgi:hypothetical protein